ncbi:Uncharacterised protein [Bordetella pertussis]|nr:Uncharacterised protein [Bordetella pertussis]CFW45824.1 Uncharacterised protein [Bordetella pertussis]
MARVVSRARRLASLLPSKRAFSSAGVRAAVGDAVRVIA